MAFVWPYARRTDYVNDSVPAVDAVDLVNMQDRIVVLGLLSIFFGSAADGDADLDGVNTVSWASKSGSTYTMTRDAFLGDLTVRAGVTLVMHGYRLNCLGDLANEATGHIHANGASGAAGTSTGVAGGAGALFGSVGGGTSGGFGAGHNSGLVGNGTAAQGGLGGQGGTGGLGSTQGTGGALNPPAAGKGGFGSVWNWLTGFVIGYNTGTPQVTLIEGGTGGGGGGADDDGIANGSNGGSGGGGGGVVIIFAQRLINNGLISADGGVGGASTIFAGGGYNGGGGAGGGGGVVVVVYGASDPDATGTIRALGGAGGAQTGGGANGGTGSNGTVYEIPLAA